MTKKPFWRQFEKFSLILALTFAALLTIVYFLLLNETTNNISSTINLYLLEVLSELIPTLLIISVSLGIFRYFENVQKNDERALLVTEIADAVSGGESIAEFGIVKIHNSFPNHRFREVLHKATSIRVLTTWISDPIRDIEIWASCLQRKDCKIEILLLDPDTEFARQRGVDLGVGEDFVVSRG